MSNPSLKEQLQALASQLPGASKNAKPKEASQPVKRPSPPKHAPKQAHKYAAKANKPPKPKWLEQAQYGVELLRAHFPLCFKSQSEVKPLKKGIKQDLVKRLSTMEEIVTEDKACMVKCMSYYVNTAAYHRSVVVGASRLDLDGQPAGLVSAEEAAYSIERYQSKLNKKRTPAQTETETA